jgi:hypothetical protein
MKGIKLTIDDQPDKTMNYNYRRRKMFSEDIQKLEATIPAVNTIVGLRPDDGEKWAGEIAGGILFNPYYTLQLNRILTTGKKSQICLYLKTTK